MEFAPLLAALALVWKIVDFAKFALARDTNAVVTQLVTWLAGVGVVMLLGASDFAASVAVGEATLDALNTWSLVLVGLTVSSTGSVLYDFKKAVDRTDSARTPPLVV